MTINEMIYKTLTTKTTKEPKYSSALKDMGLQIFESGYSHYNYWAVKDKMTGRVLVISRDRGNRRGLFDPCCLIKHENKKNSISNIDFIGYLKTTRHMIKRTPEESEYSKLRKEIRNCKGWEYKYHEDEIEKIQMKIDELNRSLEYHNKQIKDFNNRLAKVRERVKELKSK